MLRVMNDSYAMYHPPHSPGSLEFFCQPYESLSDENGLSQLNGRFCHEFGNLAWYSMSPVDLGNRYHRIESFDYTFSLSFSAPRAKSFTYYCDRPTAGSFDMFTNLYLCPRAVLDVLHLRDICVYIDSHTMCMERYNKSVNDSYTDRSIDRCIGTFHHHPQNIFSDILRLLEILSSPKFRTSQGTEGRRRNIDKKGGRRIQRHRTLCNTWLAWQRFISWYQHSNIK